MENKKNFLGAPRTYMGSVAVGLTILFVVVFLITTLTSIHISGILTMSLGVVAGILTIIVIIWKRERSWLLWLSLVPGLFAIIFAAGELIFPH